ncbi:hypothetical protein GYMLUDRAFT_412221 [Collybiopsis luxurians FD-317 M1]|nr:hypothetical protein GYMLUDRAFT_412221 [Collybiopsis luxurians FD-317 M1]
MSHSNQDHILCSNCQSKIYGLAASSGIDDTDYQSLLQRNRSNDIPVTAQDRAEMQILTNDAIRDLERYDRAISELQAGLDRLRKLRDDTARKRIGLRKFLHSPIRKLPPEILTEVFDNVAGPIIFTGEPRIAATGVVMRCGKLLGPVFSLTWVCSLWRTLVISKSRTWSSFQIICDGDFPITSPEVVNFMRECLQVRAGTAPRTITISGRDSTKDKELVAPVLDVLLETTHYWKELSFDLSAEAAMMKYMNNKLIESGISQWPRLESLYLFFRDLFGFSSWTYARFEWCPQLRHLELQRFNDTHSIDLSHLTSLTIGVYWGSTLSGLLARCLSLVELDIGSFNIYGKHPKPPVYRHGHLSHLSIPLYGVSDSEGLELPALTHLRIDLNYVEEDLPALASMLIRSRCTLQKLSVQCDRDYFEGEVEEAWNIFCTEISSVVAPDDIHIDLASDDDDDNDDNDRDDSDDGLA